MKNRLKLRLIRALALAMLIAVAAACPAFAAAKTIKTTAVSLSASGTITLNLGEQLQLAATLTPENSSQALKWSSSSKKVASVSGGLVKALKTGTTTITAKSGSKKATVKVKVVDPTLPTGVSLDQTGTVKLIIGKTLTLTAALAPETAVSTLKWTTSNKNVATVSNGVVTGKKAGTATITVTTNRGGKKATVKVKVEDDGVIRVGADYTLPYVIYASKKTHSFAILARDENGEFSRAIRVFSTGMGKSGKTRVGTFTIKRKERWHCWGSSYSPYASKHSGGLFIHGPLFGTKDANRLHPSSYNAIGTNCSSGCLRTTSGAAAWVYYNCPVGTMIVIRDDDRYSAKRPAKLPSGQRYDPTDPGANPEIPVTDFAVAPAVLTLNPGESAALAPTGVTPSNATTAAFGYASFDVNVAAVDASGTVYAMGPGTTAIMVTALDVGGVARFVPVTVLNTEVFAAPEEAPEESVEGREAAMEVLEEGAVDGLVIEEEPVADEALVLPDGLE